MKMTGAEFKRFRDDKKYWKDLVVEEETIQIGPTTYAWGSGDDNGSVWEMPIDDAAVVKILDGFVYNEDVGYEDTTPLASFARAWLKKQTVMAIVVQCNRAMVDGIRVAIKGIAGVLSVK